MKKKFLWLIAASICLFQTAFAQESVSAVNARGYLLGPGDIVEGKVLGEPDFNFESTVDEDGNIEIWFADKSVSAMCKTERELRTEVTKLVSKYIRNPQVGFRVKERKSRPPVTVTGEVKQQQQVTLTRKTRLLELLSFAGGETDKAGGMVQVVRPQAPICEEVSDYEKLKAQSISGMDVPSWIYSLASVKQGREEANPVILPGDLIVVQKASPVYVVGEVMILKEIFLTEKGLTVTEAIAQAGGFSREAKKKDIVIQRLKPNSKERENLSVNYELIKKGMQKDILLEPDDIIVVDKTKKSVAQTVLELVMGGVRSTTQVLPQTILR